MKIDQIVETYAESNGDVAVVVKNKAGRFVGWMSQHVVEERLDWLQLSREQRCRVAVSAWFPVPRWMRPLEVLNNLTA